MNRQGKRDRKADKPPRPPRPGRTTTTAMPPPSPPPPPPSPSPPPPPSANRYLVRVLDHTINWPDYIQWTVAYYQEFLAPHGVEFQYTRLDPLPYNECWHDEPGGGIVMCQNTTDPGTAGSTGPNWIDTGENTWAMASLIGFHVQEPEFLAGCAPTCEDGQWPIGHYLCGHEMGHTFGLAHRDPPNELPLSFMSTSGTWAPPRLLDSEEAEIIAELPTEATGLRMGMAMRRNVNVCDLAPPDDLVIEGGHIRHRHRRHHKR